MDHVFQLDFPKLSLIVTAIFKKESLYKGNVPDFCGLRQGTAKDELKGIGGGCPLRTFPQAISH